MNNELSPLLPLYGAVITLRFTATARLPFFHQPIVTAWLRHLLESPGAYEKYICIDTPESGCTKYRRGDNYRFTVFALPGGHTLLQKLLDKLHGLPDSVNKHDKSLPLRNNVCLIRCEDLFAENAIKHISELQGYDETALNTEISLWEYAPAIRIRWLSPVRLLLDKQQRGEDYKGEARFCRRSVELPYELLRQRLRDTLNALLRGRGLPLLSQAEEAGISPLATLGERGEIQHSKLFWLDYSYRNTHNGREQPMGGLLGEVEADCTGFTASDWRFWVLGQYLGIGQRRVFGWGRYALESLDGDMTLQRPLQATSLLKRVAERQNVHQAYEVVRENALSPSPSPASWGGEKAPLPLVGEGFGERGWDDDTLHDEPVEQLQRLAKQLRNNTYQPGELRGVVLKKPGKNPRALAIPPFFDRVAQRAVVQVLTPALDTLMYRGSFGYRHGRSRHSAKTMIQQAYQEGYQWVFESDIDDFFDSVAWSHLQMRLTALFGDDPLVELVMRWMTAPVVYENQLIERTAGLPQGAPLSPLLANMLLDDFDSDMDTAGFRLVRFADDFVVLCKSEAEARTAAQTAALSLAEIGLSMNEDKTHIRTFEQGFRYLGYLFVNSLAIDSGGEKPPSSVHEDVSERSWLARVDASTGSATASSVGDNAGFSLPEPVEGREKTASGGLIGELDDTGQMLFITGKPCVITTQKGRVFIEQAGDGDKPASLDVPWNHLQAIVLFGTHHITTPALKAAFRHRIPVHFAGAGGHYQGIASAPGDESLWLAQQLCFSQMDKALAAARSIVEVRLRHQREVLRLRNLSGQFDLVLENLTELAEKALTAADLAQLNGFEGQGGKLYFAALRDLVPKAFGFDGRNRRPPRDPFNVLLSLGHTILYAHVATLCRTCGLQTSTGFYHQPHGNHATLASDLMEPFRHIVERAALSAVNKKQLKPADFFTAEDGACRIDNAARKAWLKLLSEAFERPFLARGDAQPYKLHEHVRRQNLRLIAWIRDKEDRFQAWRMY